MFDDYFQFAPRLGIVLGGITGRLAVGFVAMSRGASFSDLADHPANNCGRSYSPCRSRSSCNCQEA